MNHLLVNKKKYLVLGIVFVVIIAYVLVALLRPMPVVKPAAADITLPKIPVTTITWPNYGQAAVGAVGYGLLTTNGEQNRSKLANRGRYSR